MPIKSVNQPSPNAVSCTPTSEGAHLGKAGARRLQGKVPYLDRRWDKERMQAVDAQRRASCLQGGDRLPTAGPLGNALPSNPSTRLLRLGQRLAGLPKALVVHHAKSQHSGKTVDARAEARTVPGSRVPDLGPTAKDLPPPLPLGCHLPPGLGN